MILEIFPEMFGLLLLGFGGGGSSAPPPPPPPPPPPDPQIEIDRQKRKSREARSKGIQALLVSKLDEEAVLAKQTLLGS